MTTSWRKRALTLAAALAGGALLLLPLVGRGQPQTPDGGAPAGNGATASSAGQATLDKLRAEHAALRDALFRSRARRDTLENALSATQLIPVISWDGGRKHVLRSAAAQRIEWIGERRRRHPARTLDSPRPPDTELPGRGSGNDPESAAGACLVAL